MKKLEIGQQVPEFTLPASNGKEVSLSDFKGKKVVIYFYPKDMTPGCTTESCEFRDFHGDYNKLNTEVIGISPDDIGSHEKFIEKYDLPFLLLADTEQKVSEIFGVWVEKNKFGKTYMGIERSTFLIDEEGKLAKEWRQVQVDGHVQEVLDAIKGG